MAGIYIHIPFCKQKCTYCDFHFSTNLTGRKQMVEAICQEIQLRKNEISEPIETIYFGGGTPSILTQEELVQIFEKIHQSFSVVEFPEITLEANPDDLTKAKVTELKSLPINRFSIGIQSFFQEDLVMMNRAHNAHEALNAIKIVQDSGFENITIDLIYGGPTTTDEMWEKNLEIALSTEVPHISSYALTVEPKTILAHQIQKKIVENVEEDKQERHFKMLCETLNQYEFEQYEISNFGKQGYFSKHNGNYWKGKYYLGIGPSAHSFDGKNRSWNVSNNSLYCKKISSKELANEVEVLSEVDLFNEMIMIRLRTSEGLSISEMKAKFPKEFYNDFTKEIQPYLENEMILNQNDHFILTEKGKFLADGISANLFRI